MSEIQIRTNFRKSLFKELKTYLSLYQIQSPSSPELLFVIEKTLHTYFQSPVLSNTGHGGYRWWIFGKPTWPICEGWRRHGAVLGYGCAIC